MCYDKLITEIINNDIDKLVELLVANETEIKSKMTSFKSFYLFYKVKSEEMITVLLDYFESRNIFDISNILTSIINVAVMNGIGIDMIQQLFDKGGNVNSTDMRGISPLLQSVLSKRDISFIKYIIEIGANVNEICDDDKNTLLHLAVGNFCEANDDDLEKIKLLIDYGADVNALNWFNELPMTKSSSTTSDELWFEFIKRGSDVDERKKHTNKTNILCYALNKKGRSLELIRKLIVMGVDVNAVNKIPDTPLVLMLKNNYDEDFVIELLHSGANVNTTYVTYDRRNSNPLLMAMDLKRNKKIISTLIDYGADVNWVGKNEITPLMCAIKNNYKVDIIHRLVNEGAKINTHDYYGLTPLMYAMKINDKEIIRRLIYSGANVNEIDKEGRSCLLYAVMYTNDEEVINLLIDKGADLSKVNKHDDELLFSIKLMKNSNNNLYTVKVLENREVSCQEIFLNYLVRLNMNKRIIFDVIYEGADVNAVDGYGCTPLINAVINNCDHEVIIKCIDSGADVNIKDKDGVSPLAHAAFSSDCKEVMKILVKYGANINIKDKDGETILIRILRSNCGKELVSNVVELGADVNLRNYHGETPLMVAIYSFYEYLIPDLDIITLLIKNGANVNVTNKLGDSALMYALSNKCQDDNIFILLLDSGADLCNYLENFGNSNVPLIRAIGKNRNVEKVIEVLRYKEDIFEVDRWGNIFLVKLVKLFKYKELALTLLRDHIDILKKDSQMMNKIVSSAVDAEFMDKIINLFGININNVDREGKTPIMYAVIHRRNGSLIYKMIEKGAYSKCSDLNFNTPLHFAVSDDVVDTLIIYGNADINAKNIFFMTPYEYASHHCTSVRTLKEYIKHLVLISLEDNIKESETYSKYNYHINECKTELDEMKRKNIINNLSYYKFCGKLSKHEKKLVTQSLDLYNCKLDEYAEFDNYFNIITMKIKKYKMNIIKRKLLKILENVIIESVCCSKENENPYSLDKLHVLNNCDDNHCTSYLMSEKVSLGFDNLYCISKYLNCIQIIKLFLASI